MFALSFVNIHNGTIIDGSLPDDANPSDYKIHIKAKMDFFSVGGITAKGGSGSNANFWKGLPIDPNTLAWDSQGRLTVVGGGGKGGDIMLNGKLYKSIDGVITLPVASNNKAFNEGIAYVKSDGITEIGNSLEFHNPYTTDQDYDYRLLQIYDNGAVLVGSGKFRATGFQIQNGTSSQFLKADGSGGWEFVCNSGFN